MAAPVFVQSSTGQAATSGTSVATNAVAATGGNCNVVTVRWAGGATTITLSDTAGNTYTARTQRAHSDGSLCAQQFYVPSIAGNASNVLTATFGAARTLKSIICEEWSGLNAAAPFVADDWGQATSGTSATIAGTLSVGSAGVVISSGAFGSSETTASPTGTGYTSIKPNNFQEDGYKAFSGASAAEQPGFSVGTAADLLVVASFFQAPVNTSVYPAASSLALTAYAPTILQGVTVSPGAAPVLIAGYAPNAAQTANQGVSPGAASISSAGYSPSLLLASNVAPSQFSATLTGYAPSLAQPLSVQPGAAALSMTVLAPTVAQSSSLTFTPTNASLALTGYVPLLVASRAVSPGAASLVFASSAPTIRQATGFVMPSADRLFTERSEVRTFIEPVETRVFVERPEARTYIEP